MAPNLPLTFACGLYDRMLPLYTGDVRPAGISLKFLAMDKPHEIFDRMNATGEFDACEMSSSHFISRLALGNCPFVALPVFPSRIFRHSHIAINRQSGIRQPKDLEGKRVGVPRYTMTAAIYIRGLLAHEYGVDLSTIQWVEGAMNVPGPHGNSTAPPLLQSTRIEINQSGQSLSQLLDAGAIDATIGASLPACVGANPSVQRLFPNFREVERDYFRRTHIFPIMHLVVLRRELYEQHPFIAASLGRAFEESRRLAMAKMRDTASLRYMLPWMIADLEEIDEVFGGDPWPYGIEANRPTLEALVAFLVEQHLIAKPLSLEDIFVRQG